MSNSRLYDHLKLHILKKMMNNNYWSGRHTNINNLPKGLPKHMRDSNIMSKIVNELLKNEWMLAKPTHYGLELSLNIKKKKEIEKFIEK